MDFDFDTPLVLRGTHSSKYDGIPDTFGTDNPDIIPMWVADMDFAAAPAIRKAIAAEVERGYFGYYGNLKPVAKTVQTWLSERQGWDVEAGAIRFNTGVMASYADTLEAFTTPGDGVIIFTPVYHEFRMKIEALGRQVVSSELAIESGRHVMDLDALEASLTGNEKVVTLCSPHNPGGRIWSADEIKAVADFCIRHDLLLIADEIHVDIVFPGHAALPTAVAAPEILDRLVVITAASKPFNIAGLKTGISIIPDPALREQIDRAQKARASSPNRVGMAALNAAYTESSDWLDAVCDYISGNFELWRSRIGALPGVKVMDMQATYLSWVDFRGTGMSDAEVKSRMLNDARVAAYSGPLFGPGGSGHMRFNLALPRQTLLAAIERIEDAFSDLQ